MMRNSELVAGDLVANRFEIDRPAGVGGMGTVYRAVDRHTGELVALKLLQLGRGAQAENERFAREAQLLARLRHPGIVAHVAHGQTLDGERFLAMEWLEGEDLEQRLARGPMPLGDCLLLVDRVADALLSMHEHGIIHRDIKPSNLFLVDGKIGGVKVLDLGVARSLAAVRAVTRTGTMVGTPGYMAPEQVRGERELTQAADLFALGCVLYQCVTGRPPFVAEHPAAVLVRILLEDPAPVEELLPQVPAPFLTLLKRLLHKDPAHRLADAALLRSELSTLGLGLDAVGDPALVATLALSRLPAARFATKEQSLLSVVWAAPSEEERSLAATLPSAEMPIEVKLAGLLRALQSLGIAARFLANQALLVAIPTTGSATDQATVAARIALLIKEHWPTALVSIATGRGSIHGRSAVGEVVERAARPIHAHRQAQAPSSPSGIFLDTLSAKLLEGKFSQLVQANGTLCLGDEQDADASRPLLGKPTPCVGREAELITLEAQLAGCIDESEARVILVTAPAGVGKSRLRHEFIRRVALRQGSLTLLLGRGDVLHAGAPYGILAQALRRLFGLHGSEDLAAQRAQLAARVGARVSAPDRCWVTEFIGELCGIHFEDDGSGRLFAAQKDPRTLHDQVQRAFVHWLAAECKVAPVLLLLDDLQWGDALSVGLLHETLRELRGFPLLIVALARPEIRELFPKLWQGQKLQQIPLTGLSRKAIERLAQQVLGRQISPELLTRLIEQSAGNALYLEELIRAAAEGCAMEPSDTMLAMLQARIGRLEPGPRRTLRVASIFGETFSHAGVAALLGCPEDTSRTEQWLASLTESEVIEPRKESHLANQQEYKFRHALMRDAAYKLLSEQDRVQGHLLAAEFIVKAGGQDPLEIAQHYQLSGAPLLAVPNLLNAAQQSFAQLDLEAAVHLAEKAITAGASGKDLGVARMIQSRAAQLLGDMDKQVAAGYEALTQLRQGSRDWLDVTYHLAFPHLLRSETAQAFALVEKFISVSCEPEAWDTFIEGAAWLVVILAQAAELSAATKLRQRLELATAARHLPSVLLGMFHFAESEYLRAFAPDPWAQRVALCLAREQLTASSARAGWVAAVEVFAAQALSELGDDAGAVLELRAIAHRLSDKKQPYSTTIAQVHLMAILARDPQTLLQSQQIAEELLASPLVPPGHRGWAHAIMARGCLANKDLPSAERHARAAIALSKNAPLRRLQTETILVEILLACGKRAEALACAEKTYAEAEQRGGGGYCAVAVLLALARARQASQNLAGAIGAVQAAVAEIKRQASGIPHADRRACFLIQVPDNAQALELASQLLAGGPV